MEPFSFNDFLDNRIHSDEEIIEMAKQVYKEWKKQEKHINDVEEIYYEG